MYLPTKPKKPNYALLEIVDGICIVVAINFFRSRGVLSIELILFVLYTLLGLGFWKVNTYQMNSDIRCYGYS